jgi:hypothetical protein
MANEHQQPFESTLQDLVYSVDAGLGLKIIRTTLFCLFVMGLMVILTARQFRGLNSESAMDQAQIGRNLAETGEYVTQCVRPVSMAVVSAKSFDRDPRVRRHPELIHPPVYPALLALQFKVFDLLGVNLFPDKVSFQGQRIFPAEQWVVVPVNHLFTALSGLLLYFLGRKLFSAKIGTLGATAFFLTEMVWRDSLSATGLPVLMFFVLGATLFALLAMNGRRERRPLWRWLSLYLLSVVFSAVAFLTHYAALAAIAGLALFIVIMGTRTQRSGHLAFFYAVLIFLAVSPWLLRNYYQCGAPLGLAPHTALLDSSAYPGDTFFRTITPSFTRSDYSPAADFTAVKAKLIANFNDFYENGFTSLGSGLLFAFFVVTFFYRFVRVHVHYLRWGIGLSMVLMFLGAGCFGREALVLSHIFWPFVILYGLAFFSILLDRLDLNLQIYKSAATGLVIGMTALPLFVTIFLSPAPRLPYPPYYPPFAMTVCEMLKPNELLCTDMPWATAWYGRRVSILLPNSVDDYYELGDYRSGYISGLYLTTLTKDRPLLSSLLDGNEKSWFPISLGRLPQDFPLRQGIPLNKQDQIFLTDSQRWGTTAAPASGQGGAAAGQTESK